MTGVQTCALPIYTELTKDEMANSIGKTDRAAIAICDEGFKKAILKILDN